jgi:hypothetical protein
MRFFCGAFLQKSDLPLRSQGCYATSCARRHIGIFLFANFFFLCLWFQKEKVGLRFGWLYYSGFVRRKPTLRFSLTQKAQRKAPKRNAAWGVSLVATSDKAYAALTRAHWRGGSYGLPCEHTDKL